MNLFNALADAEGVCFRTGQKETSDGSTMPRKKSDDMFSHLDTIHERDGQTDEQTPADSKYSAYA